MKVLIGFLLFSLSCMVFADSDKLTEFKKACKIYNTLMHCTTKTDNLYHRNYAGENAINNMLANIGSNCRVQRYGQPDSKRSAYTFKYSCRSELFKVLSSKK